jgi:hypothetical protein
MSAGSESWNSTAFNLSSCNADNLRQFIIIDDYKILENIATAVCNLSRDEAIQLFQISVEEVDVKTISERVQIWFYNFGATTFSIMTFSIITFSRMKFSKMTRSITTSSITTFNIMTFSIMTFSIMTRSKTTFCIMTFIKTTNSLMIFSAMTCSITTLSIITRSILTLSIMTFCAKKHVTQHNVYWAYAIKLFTA